MKKEDFIFGIRRTCNLYKFNNPMLKVRFLIDPRRVERLHKIFGEPSKGWQKTIRKVHGLQAGIINQSQYSILKFLKFRPYGNSRRNNVLSQSIEKYACRNFYMIGISEQ
jgi:hypothetical protein